MKRIFAVATLFILVFAFAAARGEGQRQTAAPSAPQPYDLTLDHPTQADPKRVDKEGLIYTPYIREAVYRWMATERGIPAESVTVPTWVSAPVVHVVFLNNTLTDDGTLTRVAGPFAVIQPHKGHPAGAPPFQWLSFKPEEKIWQPVGVQARSVSTNPPDLLALDSRLAGLKAAVVATFDIDAVRSDNDFILYSIATNRAGKFGPSLIWGCIRDSDVRSWK